MKNEIVKSTKEIKKFEDDKFSHKNILEKMINDSLDDKSGKHDRRLIVLFRSMLNEDEKKK